MNRKKNFIFTSGAISLMYLRGEREYEKEADEE